MASPSFPLLLWAFPRFFGGGVFLGHALHGHQRIAFVETHESHALGVAADDVDVAGGDPLDLAAGGHHQQFVALADADDPDHRAVALGGLDVANALAAAALRAIGSRRRMFALAFRAFRLGGLPLGALLGAVRLGLILLIQDLVVAQFAFRDVAFREVALVEISGRGSGRRGSACRSRWRRPSGAWPRDRPPPCRRPGRPCSGGCLSRRWTRGPSAARPTP